VSLRDETLALRLHVRPKDRSLLALRAPLKVEGTFSEPKFGVSKRALTLRALASRRLVRARTAAGACRHRRARRRQGRVLPRAAVATRRAPA
jgi:uncharacterized protein involved in outer membrane biogenesis